ncbi:ATP-binding protein [Streptomyces mangrovisoli]|uniref:ATP-binding protein n=1 Tax=Streptomyces mangrovisoli TaxID=1428628 RepID=UPI0009A0D8A2|nr:ATP-binding protein [Streptomyces mangrovisoli]
MASVIPSAPLGTDAAAGRSGLGATPGAGPGRAAAERRFRFELAAHPGSPAQARRLTRARLTGWSVCEDTCDTAALVISELVTNAIVHTASSRVVCELHDHDDTVRIAVRDEGCAPGEPQPSPQRPEEEHGRGLLLVGALCAAWGAQEHGPGLLVWAELPHQAGTPGEDTGIGGAGFREAGFGEAGFGEAPRNDLGWGARPKPVPSGGSDDDDEAEGHVRPDPAGGTVPGARAELQAQAPAPWRATGAGPRWV